MDIQRFIEDIGSQKELSLTLFGDGVTIHQNGEVMSVSEEVGGDILIRMENGEELSISEEKISDIEYYDDMNSYHVILINIEIWIGINIKNLS